MSTLRPLTPADAEMYVALRREMLLDSPRSFGASPGQDKGSDVEGVRASLAGGSEAQYVIVGAFEDRGGSEALVAVAAAMREGALKRRHIAKIWGVYVTPAARGRGLGRLVVQGAIDAAHGWPGVDQVQLSVSEGAMAARSLYESLGFVVWGVEPDCLRVDGRGEAERHMSLRIG